ncbi:MAG TPA: winged helix-turn-helix transcriptional regulator [Caldilineae bacterium]|jgi:ArsR family transcriptional regulator|nr:winged helix-turn-helix transcriptional regulator [Caldilineae bacterium]
MRVYPEVPAQCEAEHIDESKVRVAAQDLLDEDTAALLAETFKALSDPTRVRIISVLRRTELCVGDLAKCLNMEQSAISHQLRVLRQLRLVRARKVGRHVYYALDDDHIHTLFLQGLDHIRHS